MLVGPVWVAQVLILEDSLLFTAHPPHVPLLVGQLLADGGQVVDLWVLGLLRTLSDSCLLICSFLSHD